MLETSLAEVETEVPAVWRAIGDVLQSHEIGNVAQLAQTLAFDAATVREGLEYWVNCGMVEVMRPYNRHRLFDDELDYYRWKQSSDRDFLWEQTV
jgi:hypothetical protein